MKNIDISVIMGVYNEKIEWVEKAILSIINQTYTNFEFIVILDNPQNEELKNLISEFSLKDKRIKLYVNEENIGLINTLNKGLKLAKGKYIARMDADDISCGDRFEKQINFLEQNNNIVLVGGLNEYIDEEENIIPLTDNRFRENEKIKEFAKYSNAFSHPTFMFKRDVIIKVGGYRNVLYAEDYDLILNLISKGYEVANINQVILKYRVRSNGISLSKKKYQISISQYIQKQYKKSLKSGEYKIDYSYLNKIIEDEDKPFNSKLSKIHFDIISKKTKSIKKNIDIGFLVLVSNKYRVYYANKIKLNKLKRRYK